MCDARVLFSSVAYTDAKLLPVPARDAVRLRLWRRNPTRLLQVRRKLVHAHLAARLGSAFRPVDEGPAPPQALTLQTTGLRPDDKVTSAEGSAEEYWAGAYLGALIYLQLYDRAGANLRTCGSFLDFGCGTGKLAAIFQSIDGIALDGTDINERLIDWDRQHRPGVFAVNQPDPPLSYPTGSFDLVVAGSVFTHIPLASQRSWLEEIRRVMRPTGVFLCTVHARSQIDYQLRSEVRRGFDETGEAELNPGDEGLSAASVRVGIPDVFQTRSRVLAAFREVFDVQDYVGGGQDFLVLRPANSSRQ
jgi:SAM-dependent methyltransferase